MEIVQLFELLKTKTCETPLHVWCVEKLRIMAQEKQTEIVLKKDKMFLMSFTPEKLVTAAMPLTNILPVPNQIFK
jgi:hypothetical protein